MIMMTFKEFFYHNTIIIIYKKGLFYLNILVLIEALEVLIKMRSYNLVLLEYVLHFFLTVIWIFIILYADKYYLILNLSLLTDIFNWVLIADVVDLFRY